MLSNDNPQPFTKVKTNMMNIKHLSACCLLCILLTILGNGLNIESTASDNTPSNKIYIIPQNIKCAAISLWDYLSGDKVKSVAISADGRYIAAGSWDYKIYLFNRSTSVPLWNYTTEGEVYSVDISADGQYIVAGGNDDKVYLFNRSSSIPLREYTTGNILRSVSISADGQYIAAGGSDGKVYLFNRRSSIPLLDYPTGSWVYTVSISEDGQYLVAGGSSNKVYLFNRSSSTPLLDYAIESSIHSVSISTDGQYFAAGSWDNNTYVFNRSSSTPLWNYTTGDWVNSVSISADGQYLVAGSSDTKAYVFNRSSSTPLWNYSAIEPIESVAISADGKSIVVGGYDNNVYIFNTLNPVPLSVNSAGEDILSVAISEYGQYLAAGSLDFKAYLFEGDSPTAPHNPNPSDTEIGVNTSPTLSVEVFDPESETINVSFYNASDDSLIGTVLGVSSGTAALVPWPGLSPGTTYTWYAIADNGMEMTQSTTWSFTTNNIPNAPKNPTPTNSAINIGISPILSVDVFDADGDMVDVRFYDASDDSLIGIDMAVSSDSTATVSWPDLSKGTTYYWYAVADDGMDTSKSLTWSFKTEGNSSENNDENNPKDNNEDYALGGFPLLISLPLLLFTIIIIGIVLWKKIKFN